MDLIFNIAFTAAAGITALLANYKGNQKSDKKDEAAKS